MIVSDMTPPRSVPSAQEKLGPAIPSRRSSISRTMDPVPKDKQRKAARHSSFADNGYQINFSNDNLSSSSAQPRPVKRSHSSSKMNRKSSISSKSTVESVKVQRWAGLTRSVCDWDGLRKDPELWVQDGDCLVHLYGHGASRRGPSFCVPLRALKQKNCGPMLEICYAQTIIKDSTDQSLKRVQTFDNLHRGSAVELYIPAPEKSPREESYNWHITTRNFFAYVLGKPLVGRQMGQTFVDLHERMSLFRSEQVNNHQDFLEYAENQGYRDLVECTDYALASLYYAERFKLKDVWIDAFAHCVGMSDSVALSPDYAPISRLTKALVSRASLEIYIHLNRVSKALHNFLQEDFSPAYFGLADDARHHLSIFQRFLQNFYMEKFGSWPPPQNSSNFPKALYKSMFYDFKHLYDLLADTQSNADLSSQKPASGGICVLQTVDHFDKRYKFTAQAHPLPLLPARPQLQRAGMSLSVSQQRIRDTQLRKNALVDATNSLDANVANSQIIQAYMDFEKTCADNASQRENKLTMGDARKVRWLVIYCTLQYLASALQAPSAVRDTESPEYPLCCLVAGQASWSAGSPVQTPLASNPVNLAQAIDNSSELNSPYSIQPDCQREDYFNSQHSAGLNNTEAITPLKSHLPARHSSMRSLGTLSSLSARASRKTSLRLRPAQHSAIMVRGNGDGLNQAAAHKSTVPSVEHKERIESGRSTPLDPLIESSIEPPFSEPTTPASPTKIVSAAASRGHNRTRTPLLVASQLDAVIPVLNDSMTRSDSTSSMVSSVWTDGGSAASSKSSANGEHQPSYKASTAEHNGLLGGLVSVDGTRVSLDASEHSTSTICPPQKDIHPLLREGNVQPDGFQFDFSAQNGHVTNGTDVSGSVGVALSTPSTPSTPSSPLGIVSITAEKVANIDPKPAQNTALPKKNRTSERFSGLAMGALKRLESSGRNSPQPGDSLNGSRASTPTPSVTKTSHATRSSSLRDRFRNSDSKTTKKEKRGSLKWLR